jgi:hypothetical protein
LFATLLIASAACGGSGQLPAPASAQSQPSSATSSVAVASSSAPSAVANGSRSSADEDPNESPVDIEMQPLITRDTPKTAFPKANVGDRACWQDIALSGDHDKDYEIVIGRCGAPTGMLEYVKPQHGSLHNLGAGPDNDRRDTFKVKLFKGFCYRYFAVADGAMTDIDIIITTPTGAMVATDDTKSPVAIIQNNQPWCMEHDEEYHFNVDIDGNGRGKYIFAVWARPK